MTRLRKRMLGAGGLLLALVPLLMCLYLGQFSRLIVDDYAYLGKALHDGTWQALIFWRNNWSGDYSNQLIYGLLAAHAVAIPSLFPIILATTSFLGFLWFNIRVLSYLGVAHGRGIAAVVMASLAVAATFNGFFTWQTFFWFSASVENSLPATILMLCLALSLETAGQLRSEGRRTLAAIAAALLGFINAGFSEMYLVFQLSFMALLAACVSVYLAAPLRRIHLSLASAACLGSFASLLVQLSAPGVAHRASQPVNFGRVMSPLRDIGELLGHTIELVLQYAGHQAAFAGFMLMLTTGMFVTLLNYQPAPLEARRARVPVAASGLWLCLITQIILLPFLWAHTSDEPLFFWRFSLRFALILGVNLAAILALLLLIWKRSLLGNLLNRPKGLTIFSSFAALAIAALFTLTQIRTNEYRASSYMILTALTLTIMLASQLAVIVDELKARRLQLLAVLVTGIMLITFAMIIGVSLWGQGFIYERTFAPITFLLMTSGLLWGALAGILIKRCGGMSYFSAGWIRWSRLASLLAVIIIAGGIVLGQARRVDDFAAAAAVWDETHQRILKLRDEGSPALDTEEFPYLHPTRIDSTLAKYGVSKLKWRWRLYYGLDYEPHFG